MEENGGFIPTIVLNSPGGDLDAALELGRLFREHGVTTSVGGTALRQLDADIASEYHWDSYTDGSCEAACVYALIGGYRRYVAADVSLGVEQVDDDNGLLEEYVVEMGVDAQLVALASTVDPTTLYYLGADEIIDLGIDNTSPVWTGWEAEPYEEGTVAVASVAWGQVENPVFATIFCRLDEPATTYIMLSHQYDQDIEEEWYRDSIFGADILIDDVSVYRYGQSKDMPNQSLDVMTTADNVVYVTASIPDDARAALLSGASLEFVLELPHVLGYELRYQGSIENQRDLLNQALQDCI